MKLLHDSSGIYLDNLHLPLHFFLLQEPDYSLPKKASGRVYIQGESHYVFDLDSSTYLPIEWAEGDKYLSKIEEYRKAWAEYQSSILTEDQTKDLVNKIAKLPPNKIITRDSLINGSIEGKTLDELTNFPQLVYRFADSLDIYNGGELVNILETKQRYSTYSRINPASLGDSFGYSASIGEGLYELAILGMRDKDCGIIRLDINGIDQGIEVDWCNTRALIKGLDSGVFNIEMKMNVTVPKRGLNIFTFKVVGKNASSTGYSICLTRFAMKRIRE